MALADIPRMLIRCRLLGLKVASSRGASMSAIDPKQILAVEICRDAKCTPQHGRVSSSAGGQPVRRRDFISLLGTTAAVWPFAARAQRTGKLPTIGFLGAILTLALGARLPTIFSTRDFVQAGGFMSYGPNYTDLFRRAADYVDKILHGAKPAEIPVEQPTKFALVVNLTTAKALGLTIPQQFLLLADEVIE
jgi:ABC transporter substrate binding protein